MYIGCINAILSLYHVCIVILQSHTYPESETTSYQVMLVANNIHNCPDTAYLTIKVNDVIIYYVPNTFTPDWDGTNEVFKPVFSRGFDPYDYTLLIFNRWGEILFESHNVDIGWDGIYDGKLVQDDTYTWKIEFKETMSDKRHVVHGHVNVIK